MCAVSGPITIETVASYPITSTRWIQLRTTNSSQGRHACTIHMLPNVKLKPLCKCKLVQVEDDDLVCLLRQHRTLLDNSDEALNFKIDITLSQCKYKSIVHKHGWIKTINKCLDTLIDPLFAGAKRSKHNQSPIHNGGVNKHRVVWLFFCLSFDWFYVVVFGEPSRLINDPCPDI